VNLATAKLLVRRFAGSVVAAYLLHWGIWSLLLLATQAVMALVTGGVNGLAVLLGQFPAVEQETVLLRPLPGEIVEGIVPIIAGLLVGWWVLHRKRTRLQSPI
jgi:hypothetical protein